MMRRFALALGLCAGLLSSASAQDVKPPDQRPVDIHLTVADQTDILGTCAIAMRSPQITDVNSVILLGEFCARLRNSILDAARRAASAAKPTKE